MKHDDPCPSKPWNEWLVETGAEDVEEEDEAPVSTDGKCHTKLTKCYRADRHFND